MHDTKQDLQNILNVIEYQHDKDHYVNQFIELCQEQALVNIMTSLAEEKKQEFKDKLVYTRDPEKVKEVVTQYMPPEVYQKILNESVNTMFYQFLQSLVPSLRADQQEKLQQYIQKFAPNSTNTSSI